MAQTASIICAAKQTSLADVMTLCVRVSDRGEQLSTGAWGALLSSCSQQQRCNVGEHTSDASLHLVVPPRPTCCSATAELLASREAALPSSPATFTSLLHTTCTTHQVLISAKEQPNRLVTHILSNGKACGPV